MNSRPLKVVLLAATLLTPAFAAESIAAEAKPVSTVLAVLNLADGSTLEFQEEAAGGLAVTAQGRVRQQNGQHHNTINGISVAKLLRLSPAELYQAVTGGSAAPEALRAAQARTDSAGRTERSMAPPPNATKLPAASAQPESSSYCQHDVWRFCYPGTTGNWNYQRNTYLMDSYLSVSAGYPSVYHKLSRWNGSSWVYSGYSQWVGPGNWGYIYVYGGYPWKRADISGYGSRYSWAITGH